MAGEVGEEVGEEPEVEEGEGELLVEEVDREEEEVEGVVEEVEEVVVVGEEDEVECKRKCIFSFW